MNAHVPRVDGGPDAGIQRVSVPWAGPQSGFTLLMEAMMLVMAESSMTVAERDLVWRRAWVGPSKIPGMKRVARTIRAHWDGVVAHLKGRVTHGAAEAINGTLQAVQRKARGFRTLDPFSAMIHPVASGLKFDLPDPIPVTHTTSR